MKSKAFAIGSVFVLCMTVLAGVCTMTDDSEADDAKSYSWRVGTAVNESWDSLSFNPDRYTGSVPGVTVSLDYDDMADVGIVGFTGTPTTAGTYTVTVYDGSWKVIFTITVTSQSYTHTVTYSGNGNTGGSTANTVVTDTNSGSVGISLSSCGFTKTGYTFIGWKVGNATYQPGATVSVNGNATVNAVAQWSQNTLSVSANNISGVSGQSYSNQIGASANNGGSLSYTVKSCTGGNAAVNSSGLVTYTSPTVNATASYTVTITVIASFPTGDSQSKDVSFNVTVDPVLSFTNASTSGNLSVKGA